MKKFLSVLLIFLSALPAFAQNSNDSTHTQKEAKKSGPTIEELQKKQAQRDEAQRKRDELDKKFAHYSRDHFVIDLNGANWIYNKNNPAWGPAGSAMQSKWFSRGLNIAFNWDMRIKGSRVSIAPGFGYSMYTIYDRSKMVQDTTGLHFTPLPIYGGDTATKINSFTLQYLEIPIELRIRTNPDKTGNCFKIVVGVKAGMRIDVHTRVKMEEDGVTQVFVTRRYTDFNIFRVGPTVRFGYSFFNVTAYYGVLGMFKPGLGPPAHEFSLGISFMAL